MGSAADDNNVPKVYPDGDEWWTSLDIAVL
jgi:hypothetical protein